MSNLFSNIVSVFSSKKKIVCYSPFINVFISSDNNVYTCPECMVQPFDEIYLGNLSETTFDKIWKSKKAKAFQSYARKGDYSFCRMQICANRTNFHMQVLANYLKENKPKKLQSIPKIVTFGEDVKSIINCTMVDSEIKEIDINLKDRYFEILKNADEVVFSHKTDPFSNKMTSDFIKEVAEKFPNIKFNLVSNGILFNKENCDKLGITDRLSNILIYVNASNKESYDLNVHNGDFDILKQNLLWLSSLKNENKLKNVFITFLVDKNNYKEMPEFLNFNNEVNSHALFWLKNEQKNIINTANDFMYDFENDLDDFVNLLKSYNFNTKNSSLAYGFNSLLNRY